VIRLDKDVTDPRLVKALAHPLRVRILAVLDEHVASPTELAEELHAPLGNVSYHVRTLLSLGLIELVKETPRRGSVEHHYSAVARPAISDQAWEAVPESVKRAMIGAALQQAGVYVNAAAAAGSFNRANAHLSRTPLELDDEGWHAVAEELLKFMDRAQEIERDCSERLKDAPESQTRGQLLMMLFETPVGVEESAAAPAREAGGSGSHHAGPPHAEYAEELPAKAG
jgi:DNA-binding transcriptional ArsR family regulator